MVLLIPLGDEESNLKKQFQCPKKMFLISEGMLVSKHASKTTF